MDYSQPQTTDLAELEYEKVVPVSLDRHVVPEGGGVVALRLVEDVVLLSHSTSTVQSVRPTGSSPLTYHQLLAIVRGSPVLVVILLVGHTEDVRVGISSAVDGVHHGVPQSPHLSADEEESSEP